MTESGDLMPRYLQLPVLLVLLFAVGGSQARVIDEPAADLELMTRLLEKHPPEKAVARFLDLLPADSADLPFTEQELTALGYSLLGEGRADEGAAVLEMLTRVMPEAWNAWDSLGEAYIHLGQKAEAEEAYRQSLVLNPDNRNATWKLEAMDRELFEHRHETEAPFAWEPGQQTGLKEQYLGQEPPGMEPRVFAPGLISTRGGFEFSCTFSPDGNEFYFNRNWHISVCRLEDKGWTAPEAAAFNTGDLHHEAHITPDGRRLFFGARRDGVPDGMPPYGIWFMEKQGDGWGEVQYHGPGMYVTTARNGNLYLTDVEDMVGGGLAMQRWDGQEYGPLQRLPENLNDYPAAHPCIAPDESWLVFDARRPDVLGGEGDDDFYISFRERDGSWGDPVHLDLGISDAGSNMCASVTPDGKFLFFHGKRDIHWVDAAVLDKFRR
jgi:hypothetical protein